MKSLWPAGQRDAKANRAAGCATQTNAGGTLWRTNGWKIILALMEMWTPLLLLSGVCEAHCQSVCRRQAGGWWGDLPKPVQTSLDGCGVRLGQRGHVCSDLQDDGRLWRFVPGRFLTVSNVSPTAFLYFLSFNAAFLGGKEKNKIDLLCGLIPHPKFSQKWSHE